MGSSSAVEAFREAALAPSQWTMALDRLAAAFDSDGATLVMSPASHGSVAVSTRCRPFVSEYLRSMSDNPRERRVNPRTDQAFLPDFAFFSKQEIAADPFYQDYLIPRGFGWNASASLGAGLFVCLKRAWKRGAYEESELTELDRVLPWLRSASTMARVAWQSHFSGQLAAFESQGLAALLIDRRGKVVEHNAGFPLNEGWDIVEGRLRPPLAADAPRLEAFIRALQCQGTTQPPPARLAIRRLAPLLPWIVSGIAAEKALWSLHSRGTVLLVIRDPLRLQAVSRDLLAHIFSLTPTECELCGWLLAEHSLSLAAERTGISHAHARQRLKSIFHKTQTHGQAQLIALLTRLAPGIT